MAFKNIIKYNKFGWSGFRSDICSLANSERISLIYAVFKGDDVFTFHIYSEENESWQACQNFVEKILSSINVLSLKASLEYYKNGKSITVNYPYLMPCIENQNITRLFAVGITNRSAELSVFCWLLDSLYDTILTYSKIKKATDNIFPVKIKEVNLNGWETSFFANEAYSQLAVIAKNGNYLMALNLPIIKPEDLSYNIIFCKDIIEKTLVFPTSDSIRYFTHICSKVIDDTNRTNKPTQRTVVPRHRESASPAGTLKCTTGQIQ